MILQDRPERRRGIYVLPNLLTTASLFLGFLGILWTVDGNYSAAAWAILGSCIFDGLDGKVARLTRTTSDFGMQLDSLADMVAFGVSPAILVYFWMLHDFGRLGLAAAFLFIACGALRLARFNIISSETSKKFFIGLPIPAAACTLASTCLIAGDFPVYIVEHVLPLACLVLTYCVSFLMVSTIRFFSFKEFGYFKTHSFSTMVAAILIFVLIASRPRFLLFVGFMAYALWGILYTLCYLARRSARLSSRNHKKS